MIAQLKIVVLLGLFSLSPQQSFSHAPPSKPYQTVLNQIKSEKQSLLANQINTDSCKKYILYHFEHSILPYWVGRPWTYEGHTNTPYSGSIACGYFVSTTLKHMGFNWNRYELAKMYSRQIVEIVCDTNKVFQDKAKFFKYCHQLEDNLYILGLSNHVGFILKSKGKIRFVHSNYIDGIGPDKEKIQTSLALNSSHVFWIGKFLTKTNIKKWLSSTAYHIVRKKTKN